MSGLRERLQRLKKNDEPAPSKPVEPENGEWDALDARLEHNEWGSFIIRRKVYPSQHKHGMFELNELFGQAEALAALQETAHAARKSLRKTAAAKRPSLRPAARMKSASLPVLEHHEQLLFFDTETTGLGIGAGNVPFMTGIGYYEGDSFIVEQMFIRNPAEELAMLAHLNERLQRHTHLVSYNGKSFDWPIVKNRFILNRLALKDETLAHLDYLHPSRSLWKHTLPTCRLGQVEEDRLGFKRLDDVPGSLAPTLYFQYLAEGDPLKMLGVFVHNELDILSLAGLSVYLSHALQGKLDPDTLTMEEQFRTALWLEKYGLRQGADHMLERLLGAGAEETGDYSLPLAQLYKKRGDAAASAALWQQYVDLRGNRATASMEPFIELAMHYEHREKDYALALHYAEEGLNKAWKRRALKRMGTSQEQEREEQLLRDFEKRIDRLRKKVSAVKRAPKPAKLRPVEMHRQTASAVPGEAAGSSQAERKSRKIRPEYAMDSLLPL